LNGHGEASVEHAALPFETDPETGRLMDVSLTALFFQCRMARNIAAIARRSAAIEYAVERWVTLAKHFLGLTRGDYRR
jgi:hypothetical protein